MSPDYHDELVAACRLAGFSPEAQHYANSIHSQLAMVRCGLGVTLAPESSVRQQPHGLVWRELRRRVDLVELSWWSAQEARSPSSNTSSPAAATKGAAREWPHHSSRSES
nr:LysR substrate-binding domain-containing protein [Arthrobacter crystallopoietes]